MKEVSECAFSWWDNDYEQTRTEKPSTTINNGVRCTTIQSKMDNNVTVQVLPTRRSNRWVPCMGIIEMEYVSKIDAPKVRSEFIVTAPGTTLPYIEGTYHTIKAQPERTNGMRLPNFAEKGERGSCCCSPGTRMERPTRAKVDRIKETQNTLASRRPRPSPY